MTSLALEARGITHRYGTGPHLFEGLELAIAQGEVVAVTGPSGCGKSTLLYILGLLMRPDAGTVAIAGQDFTSRPDRARSHARANLIGFVFQDAVLHQALPIVDSVLEGALYAGVGTAQARQLALGRLGSLGLAEVSGRAPGEISGGQAQRAALARALVKEPAVILADEPTGNLDRASASVVLSELRNAADHGVAVVIVTHALDVVDSSDRQVILA